MVLPGPVRGKQGGCSVDDLVHAGREQLDDLLQRLVACLPGLPGFRTLSLFGSLADGRADAYSDIDLIVTTDELPAAQERLLGMLSEIGTVEFCWVIPLRPDEWNPTIVFCDEGYYRKLDLGIASTGATGRTIPPEQTTLLVEGCPALSRHDAATEAGPAYTPEAGSVGHFLLGQFLGGIRYVKARKRGQIATCYRFAAATADASMRALYEHLSGGHPEQARLTTLEYANLDALDVGARSTALLDAVDFSTPAAMDRAVCALFHQMSDLCCQIASARQEPVPLVVFQRMLGFFQRELGLQFPPASEASPGGAPVS